MEKLKIDFENCYGIGKFEKEFDFTKSNTFLVYAPNGTMKTSLTKTLAYFAGETDEQPADKVYPGRVSKYEVKVDGNDITEAEILIVNPETEGYDSSDKISTFVASKELKNRYDTIYSELEARRKGFITKLKKVSQSADCESEFSETFKVSEKDSFFDMLCYAREAFGEKGESHTFRYNDVFDKKKNVRKFLEKNQAHLDQYISSYTSLLGKSSFFKASNNSFGTYQASQILESINDNSFFEAGHSFDLSDQQKVNSVAELREIVESEIEKIVNDKELKEIFEKVDKAIGSNAELRAFSKVLEKNNLLLLELKDYDAFRRKVWLGYLHQMESEVSDITEFYNQQKKELGDIAAEARKQVDVWKSLVTTFNSRFYVPFDVSIVNHEDVVLKQENANLAFHYRDRKEPPVEKDQASIQTILSKGELKAYYILQLLFDIESRKLNAHDTLVVFDDIADSFDYKNKYAIIEYLKDLHSSSNFKILLLTHNFDFYRTVSSRLYLNRKHAVLMASKDDDGRVFLSEGQYVKDAFSHLLGRVAEPRVFISLIPFLRNLCEYMDGAGSGGNYELLTSCLHIKVDTGKVTAHDILNILTTGYKKCSGKTVPFSGDPIVDFIYRTADAIVAESANGINEIPLENKIVLSIAARLKVEEFMISVLKPNLSDFTSNQTAELFERYKASGLADVEKSKAIDKVVLMTPENIHLNAFMYEPLIDVSIWHLLRIYEEVRKLV